MIIYVYVEWWFNSGVYGNSIVTLDLWKVNDTFKGCVIKMNIKQEQKKWCGLCVILTSTFRVVSCGTICTPDVINYLRITNDDDGITGIKDYPAEGNKYFWLI